MSPLALIMRIPTRSRDDPKQALRMRRYFMAAGTSLLALGMMFACYLQGMLPERAFIQVAVLIILAIVVFYVIFRSELNLKCRDPSLTLPQMLTATSVVLYAMYAANGGRGVLLIILLMTFLFGVFRLTTRMLLFYALFILLAYGGVLLLLYRFKPQTVDWSLEVLGWLSLALTLPWFALMGGYASELRVRLQSALRAVQGSESSLAEAQRIAHLGSWTFDPVARRTTWSAETYRLCGLDPSRPLPAGDELLRLVHPEDRKDYVQEVGNAIREGRAFESQYRLVLPTGETRWVHALGQPEVDADGRINLFRGTVMDITARKAAEEEIRQLAHFDALTALPNRNLFMHLLALALARSQRSGSPLAILFIDLDSFKQINDSLGHDAGDSLLATFAQRLRDSLRKSDVAARLGGDEFVVLIEDFSERSTLASMAERTIAIASAPFELAGRQRVISASIGVAVYPEAGRNIDTLIKNADSAMYAAKQAGKNTYQFWSATTAPSSASS